MHVDRPGRLISDKMRLIENLTGVNSSKLNYYLDYKQRSRQMEKKNHSLEIIHQLVRDINIDTPIPDMITRTYQRLPLVLD
ncbi:MAG: histidine kinase, partial [Desulfurispora sp.]